MKLIITALMAVVTIMAVAGTLAVRFPEALAKENGCGEAAGGKAVVYGIKDGEGYTNWCATYEAQQATSTPTPTPSPLEEPVAEVPVAPLSSVWITFSNPDADLDGCPDAKELTKSQGAGGLRDPVNHWDYFNPTHDGLNRVDDIMAVVSHYFTDVADPPAYSEEYDRTSIVGGDLWDFGPPNGQIRVDDVLAAVRSFFHDCSVDRALRYIKNYCEGDLMGAGEAAGEAAYLADETETIVAAAGENQVEAEAALSNLAIAEEGMISGGEIRERCLLLANEAGDTTLLHEVLRVEVAPTQPGENQYCKVSRTAEAVIGAEVWKIEVGQTWNYVWDPNSPLYGQMILYPPPPTKTNTLAEYWDFTLAHVENNPDPLGYPRSASVPLVWWVAMGNTAFSYGENGFQDGVTMLVGLDSCYAW